MKGSNSSKVIETLGQTPGKLVYTGHKTTDDVEVEVFSYDAETLDESRTNSFEKGISVHKEDRVNWVNVIGLHDIDIISKVGEKFKLHKLLLEDVLNIDQRPKSEDFGNHIFFTIKMFHQQTDAGIEYEHVSFVLCDNTIISFQEKPKDMFDLIRDRLRSSYGTMRSRKADYLFYRLIDTIVDNYYLVLDNFAERIEQLEEEVLDDPTVKTLQSLQHIRKELIYLRRSVYPLRESINAIVKSESKLFDNETEKYFRDIYDHTIHVIESLETYRDLLGGIMDLYMTSVSNRMNEIMKVLTIMSAIFIPITFIAGIYGMNFEHMPELKNEWSYPLVWVLIIAVVVGMLLYFKRKKWF